MEEAILHGVLEVAERDAVLMTWYGRMPVPRIDVDSALDRTIPLQAAAITAETGYRVQVHDATLEHGIPAVWAMAISPDLADQDRPAVTCAGGAHLDPERAVLNALSELGTLVADRITCFPREVHQAAKMVHDPTLVKSIFDHPAVYGVRAAFDRLDFLTAGTDMRTLADMRARNRGAFGNTDLRDDLRQVIDRYVGTGMDVIVVDQTTPEHRAGGFVCVKAIIPGTVPITFGQHNRRIDGLPRLLRIPHRLGYFSRPLRYDELNPHPHPFT
jgi:ribosomal protein S12 methylthiotransferase accessory factor